MLSSPRPVAVDSGGGDDGGGSKVAALAKTYDNPLSHPMAASPPGPPTSPASSIGAPSSSGKRSSSSGGGGGGGAVRRLTQNLVDILESISGSMAAPAVDKDGSGGSGGEGAHHLSVAARGDSVATMTDLESGRGGAAAGAAPAAGAAVVPVQHVRRLTTTLVDILREAAASAGQAAGEEGDNSDLPSESSGLLSRRGGGGSAGGSLLRLPQHERRPSLGEFDDRLNDDRISLSSAATSSTASNVSGTGMALLRAAFLKDEYRGDDVKPFYADAPLVSAASRRVEELEEAVTPTVDPKEERKEAAEGGSIPHRLVKQRKVNPWGLTVFLAYIGAFCFYIWARAAHTLSLGPYLWYGALVLAIEILGGLAMLPYGLCLTMRVTNGRAPPPDEKGNVSTSLSYHIRVVVPCYKEPLDVIQKTFTAALVAPIPTNCSRTVYLLDDGRDVDKKKFVHGLGIANAVYVSGRKRAKGEMNGKSANINSCARALYPEGHEVPLTEVMCVFDADQVPNADFFLKTVPLLDGGADVGMVLSPQAFYNLNPGGDIFNHANVHFWDYTQPGYDALGLISCTGTNFLIRAKAFSQVYLGMESAGADAAARACSMLNCQPHMVLPNPPPAPLQAGFFPEWTLTEDFALGIELKKLNWQCRYVPEYLAIGEAPEEVRNCFQQRSRWAKGHFQVFFSKHNPIFAKGLSPLMRWMYGSVILSYFSAFTSTPLLMLVPMITVWLGAFPIVINQWAAIAITVYYTATLALQYYTHAFAHLKSMWFSSEDPLASRGFGSFGRRLFQADDPFGGVDPFASDPFSAGGGRGGSSGGDRGGPDPFAVGSSAGGDPFGSTAGDPFADSSGDPTAGTTEVSGWDLGGGWFSGMSGGNLKATSPIAFTTTLLVWSLLAFGKGFSAAGQAATALESIRWGSDYLLKTHRYLPDTNQSLLVTRVGDIDTEMLLWYRPEDSPPDAPRPAYAVDLASGGGADLGGSVAAALAASSVAFRAQNDSAYADQLLDKAKEVYSAAIGGELPGTFSEADFNLTVLYNTSTHWDDLAWAAGWLYKATKQDAYLSDVYTWYIKHLEDEAPVSDFKYAYDWDNVFWPLNLLLAQETDRPTFRQQTTTFLRSWVCAGNAANYTQKGRAYNPFSGSLGATASVAALALMQADMVEAKQPDMAREYRCWALSQARVMLGDTGRSLVVGYGRNPPKRTQDRAAACPNPPETCNRVTGLLSPDPDAHTLRGALVYGSGKSDAFQDDRWADSNRVGIENNAGLAALLAGVAELDEDLWPVCLSDYGIYRTTAVCGDFVSL
ncbi:Six-hairpin glycosidase [Micractinium conductrix]|uniref:cellulase n=1 Tax=Micractinium conductrix TaxID=554055 RepID=A0A2P6VAP0_9CHLO|nr:Six-hairpin glycosidase [Micractinium conductrix]|eukprot:PSC71157.1 Six-hairpin glycosidase [Micractinium conductrix]